jgi:hypothetical protein
MHARRYRLTIEGELSDQTGSAFHGMTLTRAAGNTLLVGRVRDQAELHGVLQRVSDLGLTLLGVVEDEPREQADKERR